MQICDWGNVLIRYVHERNHRKYLPCACLFSGVEFCGAYHFQKNNNSPAASDLELRSFPLWYWPIDDATPVSQSRRTLRFQPIACRSITRCPRVLTRPEMVWPDIASGQLAVFDMAGKRNCCYGQCKSYERYPVNHIVATSEAKNKAERS